MPAGVCSLSLSTYCLACQENVFVIPWASRLYFKNLYSEWNHNLQHCVKKSAKIENIPRHPQSPQTTLFGKQTYEIQSYSFKEVLWACWGYTVYLMQQRPTTSFLGQIGIKPILSNISHLITYGSTTFCSFEHTCWPESEINQSSGKTASGSYKNIPGI